MSTQSDLIADINAYITNYPPKAFLDNRLNSILNRLVLWIGSGGTTGPVVNVPNVYPVTSANFINATDCPIPSLNGLTLQIFWNETQRFLDSVTEWSVLPGGGFKILIPGFDSATTTFHFYVYISA